jgi:predicted transcriptional regulator
MKKPLTPVGESEMEVLHIVWQLEEATVAQIHEEVLNTRKVAYTTIMTITKKLADKGLLQYHKSGNSYVYAPARPEDEVKNGLLRQLLDKVFKGSPAELVQNLVEHESLSPAQRKEIEAAIKKLDKKS